MILALGVTAVVVFALLAEVLVPRALAALRRRRANLRAREDDTLLGRDPGRVRRAEQRARALLRSCVSAEDWEMYRELGFLRVWGVLPDGPDRRAATGGAPYAYLLYPHRPLVAYLAQTAAPLAEYCVQFPDRTRPYGSTQLPDSDDVLAKWMALTGDEARLIGRANMHLPGRQVDPKQIRRDLWRLGQWERERTRHRETGPGDGRDAHGPGGATGSGTVPAP
jgi:hypothetical protein